MLFKLVLYRFNVSVLIAVGKTIFEGFVIYVIRHWGEDELNALAVTMRNDGTTTVGGVRPWFEE